ncbi:MAG: hypothetical protein MUF30_07520 [Burkholderiales bacterium]|nr:hypothetical protein [Burkholderiales bacterium]
MARALTAAAVDLGARAGRLVAGSGALAAAAVVVSPLACAEALPDPLQPPASMRAPAVASDAAAATDSELVLQSVLLADDRRIALVNGRSLQVGDRLGAWRLVRIGDADATLRGPDGERVLALWSGVAKIPRTDATAVPSAGAAPKRTAARPRRADPRTSR